MLQEKIISLALLVAMYCGMAPPAHDAGGNEAAPLPDSMLYFGTVEEIVLDEKGDMSSLWLSSERYGEYVMILSDETVWIDSGAKTASNKSDLTVGESVYVFHSAISTLSMPPQSGAFAVVRNVPQDAGSAFYMRVDSIEEKDGTVSITANNGTMSFAVDDKTSYSPYLTRNIVTLADIKAGSRIMVWYSLSTDAADLKAEHIMLLPEPDGDPDQDR